MPLRPDAMTIQSFLDSCHFHSPKPMPNGRISSWLDVPVDIAVLVLAQAWQLDALAPRLASINSTFHRASKETALLLQGVDVCPPRLKVTVPDGESIDPKDGAHIVTFTEELAMWGVGFENYRPFNVRLPATNPHGMLCSFDEDTARNLLDVGNVRDFLCNIVIDSFFRTFMMDIFQAKQVIANGGSPPAQVFLPCFLSGFLKGEDMPTVDTQNALGIALRHAKEIYVPYHFGETFKRANHWVLGFIGP